MRSSRQHDADSDFSSPARHEARGTFTLSMVMDLRGAAEDCGAADENADQVAFVFGFCIIKVKLSSIVSASR